MSRKREALIIYSMMFLCSTMLFAKMDGDFVRIGHPEEKMTLADGLYDIWIEKKEDVKELETGEYHIDGSTIHFKPETFLNPSLHPSQAKIVDECTIVWKRYGRFRRQNCRRSLSSRAQISQNKHPSGHHTKVPSKRWKVVEKKGFRISVPQGSRVTQEGERVVVRLRNAIARAEPVRNIETYLQKSVATCQPKHLLKNPKDQHYWMLCDKGTFPYKELLFKQSGHRIIATQIEAKSLKDLKTASLTIASIAPHTKQIPSEPPMKMKKWMPQDGSFSILIPEGWSATGGTADLGVNGYVRIVEAFSPDHKAAFLGLYYPFYQYVQSPYGNNGIPPMEPESYIRARLFDDLSSQYGIEFPNLQITRLHPLPSLSQQLTSQTQTLYRRYGIQTQSRIEVITADAKFDGEEEMKIVGTFSYTTQPLGGMGYSYRWGPAPLFIATAPKGGMHRYIKTYEKMAQSFQVEIAWLRQHMANTAREQQNILRHYQKMSKIIHENSEARMWSSLREHEAESHEKMEEFWDTFYALGGEERLDNPQTGEEIDLPTGADRYLYDRYSQTWIGLKEENPDTQEIVQHLKERGYVELKLHTH